MDNETIRSRWHRAAQSRLTMELAGLSFAVEHGHEPEEYARHLWSDGAARRMGKASVPPLEFIRREGEAISVLWPWVRFETDERGDLLHLVFTEGCLGTGQSRTWKLAAQLRLSREEVCRYCIEAFRVWGEQLGLRLEMSPMAEGGCAMEVAQDAVNAPDVPSTG